MKNTYRARVWESPAGSWNITVEHSYDMTQWYPWALEVKRHWIREYEEILVLTFDSEAEARNQAQMHLNRIVEEQTRLSAPQPHGEVVSVRAVGSAS